MAYEYSPSTSPYRPLTRSWFRTLAFAAMILLWVPMVFNGSFEALLTAPLTGHLNSTTELRTNYTGFFPLDYFIGVMVGFFFPATCAQDEGYQIAALGLLWQTFGAAIILPIYYTTHIEWASQKKVSQVASLDRARALTPAFILGVVAPTATIMAPTWIGPDYRSAEYHQTLVAIFMLSPVWVSSIQEVATRASAWQRQGSSTRRDKTKASMWTRAVYLQTCVVSAAGHLYPMYKIFTAKNPENVNLTRLYIPSPFEPPSGTTDVLVIGSWLFLQYDHIIISLSSLSWVLVLLRKTKVAEQLATSTMICRLLIGSVLIGPGATVSLALYFREGFLESDGGKE
ncbi:MAG: hypothetical protein M1818_008072 [Claussenomyces sp. TS43310]|nr:MAG: hypothetical protein M1818_008072 [Claussenomyces sp. TS43310]